MNIATIPENGIMAEILDLKIMVHDANTTTMQKFNTAWQPLVQKPGRNQWPWDLFITTHAHLATGRQWLDYNLPIIFDCHLLTHLQVKLDKEYLIAQWVARKLVSRTMQMYADILKNLIPILHETTPIPIQLQNHWKSKLFIWCWVTDNHNKHHQQNTRLFQTNDN